MMWQNMFSQIIQCDTLRKNDLKIDQNNLSKNVFFFI